MDSYEVFINELGISFDEFIDFGINNTIYPDFQMVKEFWKELKSRIENGEPVYIRGLGRNGGGNELIKEFYAFFGINIIIDPSNNMVPTRNLQKFTGKTKNKNLFNYQVAHIFGKTKNVYMFESPWNICFVPKMFDPLTGHEAKGIFPDKYKEKWLAAVKEKYQEFIADFNSVVESFNIKEKLEVFTSNGNIKAKYGEKLLQGFIRDLLNEFAPIN